MRINWRRLRALACYLLVWLGILLLAGIAPAWARPGQQPGYQTVPTLPPTRPPATPTATAVPAATATPSAPGLEISWRAAVGACVPGGQFAYELNLRNAGGETLEKLEARLSLPSLVKTREVRLSAGRYQVGEDNTLIAWLDALPAGATWSIHVMVQVDPSAPLGAVLEAQAEVSHAGHIWSAPAVIVALPPAELPPTGGSHPRR